MPETEPVTVIFDADTEPLQSGAETARQSLRSYGDEAERTEGKSFKLVRASTSLLGSILAIRGAFSITTNILINFGIVNEGNERILKVLETEIQVVVAALQIYRAISAVVTIQDLARAKASFLAGIAAHSYTVIGIAAATAAAIAA